MDKSALLTETNTITEMINHPALVDFGVHLLPRPLDKQSNLLLRDAGVLMPWHSHIQPQTENDPPTFAVVSSDDPIASARVMKKRIDCLKELERFRIILRISYAGEKLLKKFLPLHPFTKLFKLYHKTL